jgi:predicted lipoprotein with Yx(FWY)xxD motif
VQDTGGRNRARPPTEEQGQLVRHRGQIAGSVILSAGLVVAALVAPALGATQSAHKGTKIATRHIKLGKVLTNSKGTVMYLFTQDGKKVSHCNGACAAAWPRVTSKHKPRAGAGVSGKHLSRTSKHDQVTYYGHPLYYFSGDSMPSQASGEGVSGFYVVSTHGTAIKPTTSKSAGGAAEVASGMVGSNEVLTNNADGHTLYELKPNELPNFACTGSCTKVWLPLLTKGAPTAGGDAMQSLVGTATRPDSTTQVTYNGFPVYEYTGDSSAGQANGEGIPGPQLDVWYDVAVSGSTSPY